MDAIHIPAVFWSIAALALVFLVLPTLDKKNPEHRVWVSAAGISSLVVYLLWRVTSTISPTSTAEFWLMSSFFALETLSILSSVIVLTVLTRWRDRAAEVSQNETWMRSTQPSAAIFIATYNEGIAILERTITGALGQNWPTKVYVLDDGCRPEVQALCERRGVTWLTRPDNRHAKAGNMNAALESLRARGELPEFVAILDADFIALPDFLRRSLALFRDPKVGVVQTPQHFFNPDPLQHRIRAHLQLPDEQRFFFDTLLPARDGWSTAFSCGTSSVVRISALEHIGGFPTESITEDMLLSIRLKRNGFVTAYLNERLSLGLAPEGIGEYCTQRIRWCVGAMQILSGKDGILHGSGLTSADRISMMETLLYWCGSFPFRLACLLIPMIYWFSGITVMDASVEMLATFLLPRLIIESAAIAWYSTGRVLPLLTDASQLLIAPEVIAAAAHTLLFPGERPFKVTPKGLNRAHTTVHWGLLYRFALVLGLTAIGMIGTYLLPSSPAFFSDQKSVVALWSIYNILVCSICIIVAIETPRRAEERIKISYEAILTTAGGVATVQLVDVSASGVAFKGADLIPGENALLEIPGLGEAPIEVVRRSAKQVAARVQFSPEQLVTLSHMQFADWRAAEKRLGAVSAMRALLRGLLKPA